MFVSYEQSQGHSCIRLDDEGKALVLASGLAVSHPQNEAGEQEATLPLVVEQDRLYLHRYWFYENRLAMQIKAMIQLSEAHGQKIAAAPMHCLTSILALAQVKPTGSAKRQKWRSNNHSVSLPAALERVKPRQWSRFWPCCRNWQSNRLLSPWLRRPEKRRCVFRIQ